MGVSSSLSFSCSQGQTGAIDDVHRTVVACDDEAKRNEGKAIVENLAKLKYELQHNRQITYMPFSHLTKAITETFKAAARRWRT